MAHHNDFNITWLVVINDVTLIFIFTKFKNVPNLTIVFAKNLEGIDILIDVDSWGTSTAILFSEMANHIIVF